MWMLLPNCFRGAKDSLWLKELALSENFALTKPANSLCLFWVFSAWLLAKEARRVSMVHCASVNFSWGWSFFHDCDEEYTLFLLILFSLNLLRTSALLNSRLRAIFSQFFLLSCRGNVSLFDPPFTEMLLEVTSRVVSSPSALCRCISTGRVWVWMRVKRHWWWYRLFFPNERRRN